MEFSTVPRSSLNQVGIEGVLLVLTPLPVLLACAGAGPIRPWTLSAAALTATCCCLTALLLLRHVLAGRLFGFLTLLGCVAAGFPFLQSDPLIALLGAVALIQSGYALSEFRLRHHASHRSRTLSRSLQRARSGAWTLLPVLLAALLLNPQNRPEGQWAAAAAVVLSQGLVVHWLWLAPRRTHRLAWMLLPMATVAAALLSAATWLLPVIGAAASLTILVLLPKAADSELHEQWWEPLVHHPARVLLSTFFGLCLAGTLLLQLPWATSRQTISAVDAAFTSVSAVCVTGLIVLDTPKDFTLLGQALILLLIQLGGLGIMTITTVALHAMGKRLSLRQERLLTSLTETSHLELIDGLRTIVRFTLSCELIGALLLAGGFYHGGLHPAQSLWQGLFTSVSAFCNAGFSLQSANLVPFQTQPLILHTVALLIVLGGLAPATCLLLPQWLRGRPISLAPRIALVTSAVLLVSGTLCFLIFEWDNSLAGLDFADKLHNAWFQSVTLRTAGFNSIDLSHVLSPTYLVMISFMFIGGSPGGTAGGIKTTTIGILAMTFWASITGHNEVIAQNRRIPQVILNRAVTVFASGAMIWFLAVMMVALTQPLAARDLIFEVTSALGTVGLSLGATASLDGIGKSIIMLTMFIGRIGPMTLFTLLSADLQGTDSRCPDARITLT